MSIKVIAIGNRLMGNDMIGLRILEKIASNLRANNIETFIGETDFEYCLSILQNHDFIFVIDAALFGHRLGEITVIPFAMYDAHTHADADSYAESDSHFDYDSNSNFDSDPHFLLSTSQPPTSSIKSYSQHLLGLLDLIHFYHKDLKGYVIGIEVENIACSLNLSKDLELLLNHISLNVYHQIMELINT